MKKFFLLSLSLLLLVALPGCDSFVENADDPITSASDEALNDPVQLPFATTGVFVEFAETHDQLTLAADLLSDQFRFGTNGDATFPTFRDLDNAVPQLDNNTVDGAFGALGQYRFLADRLIERADVIAESGGFDGAPMSETEVRFNANLHGAIARYFYAAYFGLNPREGGGVIESGPFIPEADMYDEARTKFETALNFVNFEASGAVPTYGADAAARERLINSFIARIEFNQGNYAEAVSFAANGLQQGDAPLLTLHNDQSTNEWWSQGGRGRVQVVATDGNTNANVVDPVVDVRSFIEIANENPQELARIPLTGVTSDAGFVAIDSESAVEFAQDKYPERSSGIPVLKWQENYLMLAEAAARGEDISGAAANGFPGTALELVNAVRGSHGIDPLGAVDVETILAERDKEMFGEGMRLIDQRRAPEIPWHLPETLGARQTWQYLPITQQERNDNPNFN